MAMRMRRDGTMWCAAHTQPMEGDAYIDDGVHYLLSVELGVIVALPMPAHEQHCQWWWIDGAPPEADRWVEQVKVMN